ncbi:conserved hypothetical protein [Hahella chejuensis KCTC 2396]|uniref:Uncharacterized protein n=1 Tax=Hahella chejuensis (strain KCTC 2396) TaxID=349521 RepID=Q2SAH8_HAHCH|nr:hypothetical protein [Hahella chejuensis]ABC32346.1 conserved hypothetical protein [Hahella chejuensis KCTC 2396]
MSRYAMEELIGTPAKELAEYSGETLYRLRTEASIMLAAAKVLVSHLDYALEAKYGRRAKALRRWKEADSVSFEDGAVDVHASVSERVEWRQDALTKIARRIAEAGCDPADFLDITYCVSEDKYNAWPQSLRRSFEQARIRKPGKPSIRLSLREARS